MAPAQIPAWFCEIELWDVVNDCPLRPMFSQVTGLNLLCLYSRSALYDEQGCGKTLPAQAMMIWHAASGNRALALMPPILMPQFINSLNQTFRVIATQEPISSRLGIAIYHGTPVQRNKLAKRWTAGKHLSGIDPNGCPEIVVTTPTMFLKEWPIFASLDFETLTCDECDYFANPDTQIFRAIKQYLGPYDSRVIVGMNGTPAKNNLEDLYGYITMITPWVYKNRTHFYAEHVVTKELPIRYNKGGKLVERDIEVIDSFINTDKLRKNLLLQARRVEKKDVLEIPDMQTIMFDVRLSDRHQKAYDHFVNARAMEFPDGTAISGEQTATLRQICMQAVMQPEMLGVKEESAIIEAIKQLLSTCDVQRNKVFITVFYQKTVERITAALKEFGTVNVYGGNSGAVNQRNANKFRNDPDCRVLVANYQSGGVGLNFQFCKYMISGEPTTVPGEYDQTTARLHRKGQLHKVTIYVLNVLGTIWPKAVQKMLQKREDNNSVVYTTELVKELLGDVSQKSAAKAA